MGGGIVGDRFGASLTNCQAVAKREHDGEVGEASASTNVGVGNDKRPRAPRAQSGESEAKFAQAKLELPRTKRKRQPSSSCSGGVTQRACISLYFICCEGLAR